MKRFFLFIFLTVIVGSFSGCTIGFLLFYRDSKTATVYKSSASKSDYYIIKATTLSHCGCTFLDIYNYKNGKKDFHLFYSDNVVRKTVYKFDSEIGRSDTLHLMATAGGGYIYAFDSADNEIFKRIDSIAIQKPKGIIYPVKITKYKGYIGDISYNYSN
ncbi:MAG: hypothetical protein QM725_18370 [Lacibacter sp.]